MVAAWHALSRCAGGSLLRTHMARNMCAAVIPTHQGTSGGPVTPASKPPKIVFKVPESGFLGPGVEATWDNDSAKPVGPHGNVLKGKALRRFRALNEPFKFSIRLKGSDWGLMEGYLAVIQRIGGMMGCKVSGIIRMPCIIRKVTVLRSKFVHKRHMDVFEERTHVHFVEVRKCSDETQDLLLHYIERNLPAGIAMRTFERKFCAPEKGSILELELGKARAAGKLFDAQLDEADKLLAVETPTSK